MSPRSVQTPLSGRDRRHFAKHMDVARKTYAAKIRQSESARRFAVAKELEANWALCEAWNAALFMGGPAQPSPTIAQALSVGCDLLKVECNRCGRSQSVQVAAIRRRPETFLWQLEASFGCEECRKTLKYKPRAIIMELGMSDPKVVDERLKAAGAGVAE